jgi:hypothetical protein
MISSVLILLATAVVVSAQNYVQPLGSVEVTTCCAIQSQCNGCPNVYKVNSITYCCPGCTGEVLVTALVCSCSLVVADPRFAPNCTVSNKVVGDYIYERPSYYTSGVNYLSTATTINLLLVALLTILACHWR